MKKPKQKPPCEHEPYPLPPARTPIERLMVITEYLCRKCGKGVKVPRAAR
jgi:hypothetical protein